MAAMSILTPPEVWGFILWRGLGTAGYQAHTGTLTPGYLVKIRHLSDSLSKTKNPAESSLLLSYQTTSPKGNL